MWQITKPRNPEPLPSSKIRLQHTSHTEVSMEYNSVWKD